MIKTMFEYIQNLPPLAQFILILVALSGTPTGLVAGIFAVWKMREATYATRENTRQKERLEAVENNQIKIQADADHLRAINANMERLITGVFRTDERWQMVVDNISARRVEIEEKWMNAIGRFELSVQHNTTAVTNLTAMLELQSEQIGHFDKTMQHVEDGVNTSLQQIETLTKENRADLTTALGMNVNQQNKTDETLRTILVAITAIEKNVTGIISLNEKERNQNLSAIKAQLQAIEKNISDLIAPRPLQLGDTMPLPALRDSEDTIIIAPAKHDNEDDNPLLNKSA